MLTLDFCSDSDYLVRYDTYLSYASSTWTFVRTSPWANYTGARRLDFDQYSAGYMFASFRLVFSDMRTNTHLYAKVYNANGGVLYQGDITSNVTFNLSWGIDASWVWYIELTVHNSSHAATYCDNNTPDITHFYAYLDDYGTYPDYTVTEQVTDSIPLHQDGTSQYSSNTYWEPVNATYMYWSTDHWYSVPDSLVEASATWYAITTIGTWSDEIHYAAMNLVFTVTGLESSDTCYALVKDNSANILYSGTVVSGVPFELDWSESDSTDELYYLAVGVDSNDGSYQSNIAISITKIFVEIAPVTLSVSDAYSEQYATKLGDLNMSEVYHLQYTNSLVISYTPNALLIINESYHTQQVDSAPVNYMYVLSVDITAHLAYADEMTVKFPVVWLTSLKFYRCSVIADDNTYGGVIDTTSPLDNGANVFNKLFPDVTAAERGTGLTTYRKLFIKNIATYGSWLGGNIYIASQSESTDDAIAIALGTASDTLADALSYTFVQNSVSSGALTIPSLHPGQSASVWIRRTVNAGAAFYRGNTFSIGIGRS